ncbi:MAG: FeoA domain-containing protein [Erysipelotrichaceae bacterium]
MKLTALKQKKVAIIQHVYLPEKQSLQLFHLGFYQGAKIEWIRFAPFHDPCLYKVSGNYIMLRNLDAAYIQVKEIDFYE